MNVVAVQQAAQVWRGRDKADPRVSDFVRELAREHPILPFGLPPEVAGKSANVSRENTDIYVGDLISIQADLQSGTVELGLGELTLFINASLVLRAYAADALPAHPTDQVPDQPLSELARSARALFTTAAGERRRKAKELLSRIGKPGGMSLLDVAWLCTPPRHEDFPTPTTRCPASPGCDAAVMDRLGDSEGIDEATASIWDLITGRAFGIQVHDDYAKNGLRYAIAVYKTCLSSREPTIVQGLFFQPGAPPNQPGTGSVHDVFVCAWSTGRKGSSHKVETPSGFRPGLRQQVKAAVCCAISDYVRSDEEHVVSISLDDLPGGTGEEIQVEGESLGLAVALGTVCQLTGRTVDRDWAITGKIVPRTDPVRVNAVQGIEEKVAAALADGITRIAMPAADVAKVPPDLKRQCRIVGVRDLSSLVNRIWVFDAHASDLLRAAVGSRAPTPVARRIQMAQFFEELYQPQEVVPLTDGEPDLAGRRPLGDLVTGEGLPSQIVLFGESGLGKTVALLYLMYLASACAPNSNARRFVPWYVRMREYAGGTDKVASVYSALAAGRPPDVTFDGNDMKRAIEDPQLPPMLILVDALNEQSAKMQVEIAEAIKEFCARLEELNKRRNGKHRLILTYRKEPHVRSLVADSLRIEDSEEYELQRLGLDAVAAYLSRCDLPDDFRSRFSQEVQDLFRIPLFMYFAVELAQAPERERKRELKEIKNKAQLYEAVTELWLRREWWDERTQRFVHGTQFIPLTDLALECCVDFHARALGEVAYRMIELGLTELPADDLTKTVGAFVKNDLSRRSPQDFAADGPWQWLREHIKVADVPTWARDGGDSFERFVGLMTESLIRSTVLQGL